MYFQIYRDVRNEWRWKLKAANHVQIASSGEGYINKNDCLHAIELVQSASNAPIYE